ncbi:hypothetical protein [Pontibacter anaerobius]|uniref:Lipoprotein n=1 Tax=Pontibacter anaerobius TaxID=2993940 RepID=A0ABT3RBT3_9BACT|nr:hypothetical protein [Pontibacter anaerobius]MCX2738888.1 hypothetical protein [Pontibacter anaerobius]
MMNYLLSLLIILLAMTQCQRDETLPTPQGGGLGEAFVLEQGERIKITGGETNLMEMEVEEVADSRCPEDVVCVWYGNAVAKLKIYSNSGNSQALTFCIGDCRPAPFQSKHTLITEVGGKKYEITLLEVIPFPNTKQKTENKQVKLLVNKAN